MGWVVSGFLAPVQLAIVVGLWFGLSWLFVVIIQPHVPAYGLDYAVDDATWFLVMLGLWDRLFGPSSKHLRGVGKALKKAKKRRAE